MLALTREMYISPPRARSTLGVRLHPRISFALAVTCGMPWGPSPWRAEPWVTRGLPEHLQWVPRPRILSAEDGGFEEQGGHAFSRVSPAEAWGGALSSLPIPSPCRAAPRLPCLWSPPHGRSLGRSLARYPSGSVPSSLAPSPVPHIRLLLLLSAPHPISLCGARSPSWLSLLRHSHSFLLLLHHLLSCLVSFHSPHSPYSAPL